MKNETYTELFRAIESIKIENLNDDDKKELLKIFNHTENFAIRNQIALIFAEVHYHEAVPFILKKINDEALLNKNGTLVYSLESLHVKKHFIDLIKIVCEQEYEARLMAYEIIENLLPSVSVRVGNRALKILDEYQKKLQKSGSSNDANSKLHFIESTIALLES